MKFIRYGSLKPQFHDIDNLERTFHLAPVYYGIYAFPVGYVETFLLGGAGSGSVQNGRYHFLRDEFGKKIKDLPDNVFVWTNTHKFDKDGFEIYKNIPTEKYQDLFKRLNIDADKVQPYVLDKEDDTVVGEDGDDYDDNKPCYFVVENEPVKFEYTGNIWCHFGTLAKRNEIIREVGSWILVDINYYKKLLKQCVYADKRSRVIHHNEKMYGRYFYDHKSVSGFPISYLTKDHYEVFIEKV